jgi:hypothetical protein
MFKTIKQFFQDRKIKKQLKTILGLLYSEKRYERKGLIQFLKPKDEIEEIKFHIIIDIATNLRRPFTEETIDEIYSEQLNSLEEYFKYFELKENIVNRINLQTDLNVMEFNIYMNRLQRAYKNNINSPGGAIYCDIISKGNPLTEEEEIAIGLEANEILKLKNRIEFKL